MADDKKTEGRAKWLAVILFLGSGFGIGAGVSLGDWLGFGLAGLSAAMLVLATMAFVGMGAVRNGGRGRLGFGG